jgi:hypothetical protein
VVDDDAVDAIDVDSCRKLFESRRRTGGDCKYLIMMMDAILVANATWATKYSYSSSSLEEPLSYVSAVCVLNIVLPFPKIRFRWRASGDESYSQYVAYVPCSLRSGEKIRRGFGSKCDPLVVVCHSFLRRPTNITSVNKIRIRNSLPFFV